MTHCYFAQDSCIFTQPEEGAIGDPFLPLDRAWAKWLLRGSRHHPGQRADWQKVGLSGRSLIRLDQLERRLYGAVFEPALTTL
jgi:hypothetical protein